MEELTRRQRAIYEFIVEQVRGRGMPPTLMEIARAFGLSSAAGIADHLKAIERKGYIRRQPGASRGIQIVARATSRPRRRSVRIPVLGSVPGRKLREAAQADRYLLFDGRVAPGEAFAVRARIEGLEGRGILRGDYLIVRRGVDLGGDQIGVARVGDRILLVETDRGNGIRPLHDRGTEGNGRPSILGRVIAVLRAMEGLD